MKFIKKYKNICVIVLIQLMIIGFCLYGEVYPNDELWCFQNICKMINGYKIYVDCNVIQTPIFFFIGYVILKVFGANLFIFRLYNFAIMTSFLYITYLVMKKLTENTYRSLIYFLILMIIGLMTLTGSANYNEVALLFVLLGIYLNLIWQEKRKTKNIIQATIMFLVFFSKQNIGVYYIIGIIIYEIISKNKFFNIIKQMFILGIETFILMLIFLKQGILKGFINYTVLGISEFATENLYYNITSVIGILAIALIALFMTIFIIKSKEVNSNKKDKLLLITCVSIPMLLSSYPIFNTYHILMGIYIIAIDIIYILDITILSEILNKNKILNILIIVFTCIIIIGSIFHLIKTINYMADSSQFNYKDYYYGAFFADENRYEEYKNVLNYIESQNEEVAVISYKAALYMIPLEKSNGAIDLPFYGNMGTNGESNMIKHIGNMYNTKILILRDINEIHGQESKKINQYIRDNFNYISSIEEFDIFEKRVLTINNKL